MEIRSRTSKTAHFLERIGLALAGASCGLFVAAHVGRASFEILGSTTAVLAMTFYGAIGFYLGIDIPPHTSFAGRTDPAELFSAIGTFLASTSAFVAVYSIVVDTEPQAASTLGGCTPNSTTPAANGSGFNGPRPCPARIPSTKT